MSARPNAPGCSYPIPPAGSQDWDCLIAMLKGMAAEGFYRANEIRALDDPAEDVRKARERATADAYEFAALMIKLQREPAP